jgi:hypothetical protein
MRERLDAEKTDSKNQQPEVNVFIPYSITRTIIIFLSYPPRSISRLEGWWVSGFVYLIDLLEEHSHKKVGHGFLGP